MPPNPSTASGNNSRQSVQASGFAATSRTPKSVTFADGGKKKVLDGSEVAERMKKKDSKLLTDLAEHVVSRPLQIATVIEKDATSMLNLYREISLKLIPLNHFDLKFKKPNGEEEQYLPGCVRKLANPTTATYRIKELDEFKTIVSDYEDVLTKYKEDATNLLKKVAKLEVSHREQLLFEQVCKSAARLAKNYITAALTRAKIANPNFNIETDKDVLAWRVARDYCLEHIRDDRLRTLKFDSSVDMIVAFDKVRQSVSVNECQATFTEPSAGSQDDDDEDLLRAEAEDRQIYGFAKLDLSATAPKMTFDIWALVSEEDLLRSINEELTILNKNEEQSKINEATADAMANDLALTKSTIMDLFKTEMGKLKKEIRANSLAVPKTQGAAGGKPGQKSRKRPREASGDSPAGSSKKKQKKENQKKTSKKKKNQQQQQQQQQTGNQQQQQQRQRQKQKSNKAGKGNRGGANSGGRGRGRNRR
jgi:hypothetical protein